MWAAEIFPRRHIRGSTFSLAAASGRDLRRLRPAGWRLAWWLVARVVGGLIPAGGLRLLGARQSELKAFGAVFFSNFNENWRGVWKNSFGERWVAKT